VGHAEDDGFGFGKIALREGFAFQGSEELDVHAQLPAPSDAMTNPVAGVREVKTRPESRNSPPR
jgi:hypothetical protein